MAGPVGFNFQGDVFAGGSLAFSAAGRLMKILSDANIDMYAVATLTQVSNVINIDQSQELMVAKLLERRRTKIQSFLFTALSIGWNQADVAYEISRTRGGCSMLLLMSAICHGDDGYTAAQNIQRLVELHGCPKNLLPSIDAICTVVNGLLPILDNSGFGDIVATIRLSLCKFVQKNHSAKAFSVIKYIIDNPGSKDWTNIATQLILIANNNETIFIDFGPRTTWLAAFAVYILRMRVQIKSGLIVVWEAAGSRGSVFFHLHQENRLRHGRSPATTSNSSLSVTLGGSPEQALRIELSEVKDSKLIIACPLHQCISIRLSLIHGLSRNQKSLIMETILDLMIWYSKTKRFGRLPGRFNDPKEAISIVVGGDRLTFNLLTSKLQNLKASILAISKAFAIDHHSLSNRIESQLIEPLPVFPLIIPATQPSLGWKWRPETMAAGSIEKLYITTCLERLRIHPHQDDYDQLTTILKSTALDMFSLMLCEVDLSAVRIDPLTSLRETSEFTINSGAVPPFSHFYTSNASYTEDIIGHLAGLICSKFSPDYNSFIINRPSVVSYCGNGFTICSRGIMEDQPFSECGRFIAIYPGMLTSQGCSRSHAIMSGGSSSGERFIPSALLWTLAPQTQFDCPRGDMVQINRRQDEIRVFKKYFQLKITIELRGLPNLPSYDLSDPTILRLRLNLDSLILRYMFCLEAPNCNHNTKDSFLVPDIGKQYKAGFFKSVRGGEDSNSDCLAGTPGDHAVLILHGDTIWKQMLQTAFVYTEATLHCGVHFVVLQGKSCLNCAFKLGHTARINGKEPKLVVISSIGA
jgi:hypothetical protein